MKATCLVCTLKRSPEESNSEALAQVVLDALRDEESRPTSSPRRPPDRLGVVSEAVTDGDEWPGIRDRILASEILVMAIPTWLGQPSSVFEGRARADGRLPVGDTPGRQDAGRLQPRGPRIVVVGNEDGAHHVDRGSDAALNDIGYSMPGQMDLLEQGPGPR